MYGSKPQIPISAMNGWSLDSLSGAAYNRQLAAMEAVGVRVVRDDAPWQEIEPSPPGPSGPRYQWAGEDNRVRELANHHLRLLPILDYSTTWGAKIHDDWRSPPANDEQFAGYARAVAARYGRNGAFWKRNPQLPYEPVQMFEVWNEENGGYFWDTGPDPAGYARLYLTSRRAIRTVDPSARVIVGGLANGGAGTAEAFLKEMFAAVPALKAHIDGVGFHPYQQDGAEVDSAVIALRETLDSLGAAAVPIDVTEFGWPVDTPSEGWRTQQMGEVARALADSSCGVALIAPYDWYNPPGSTGSDFGLSNGSSLRPSGTAWFHGLGADRRVRSSKLCGVISSSAL